MDATFTMYNISISIMSGSRLKLQVFSNDKIMYIRSIQKENIILYSICHGRNCDRVQLAIGEKMHTTFGFCTATDYNPAFVLVEFTIL